MTIKFLKAGSGDSILIHHNTYNILIDGGNDSKYLIAEIDKIFEIDQKLDLVVVTHHDDDHIKGIIDLFKKVDAGDYGEKNQFVKEVIFNSPRQILGKILPNNDRLLSYKQAHELEEIIMSINPKWQTCTEENEPMIFDGMTITFLSPTKDDIKEYAENKGAYLSSYYKCDWNSPMNILEKYIDDKSQDDSLYNRGSVVIMAEYEEKKILLPADVTPKRLELVMSKLFDLNDKKPIKLDFFKLPHHGSYRSLNKATLEKISCKNFIVSTDSRRYFLPNKRAILKIAKYVIREPKEKLNFLFNYSEALTNVNVSDREKKDYNLVLVPNNKSHGIVI